MGSPSSKHKDPTIRERLAALETDMAWVKRMTGLDTILLVITIISILAMIAKGL